MTHDENLSGAVSKAVTGALQHPQHDPMYTGLGWVLILCMLGSAIAYTFMRWQRTLKSDSAANAKDAASEALYNQLAEQVQSSQQRLDEANKTNLTLVERVSKLEALMQDYGVVKQQAANLVRKLDTKDEELRRQLHLAAEERNQFLNLLTKRDTRIEHLEQDMRALQVQVTAKLTALQCPLRDGAAS